MVLGRKFLTSGANFSRDIWGKVVRVLGMSDTIGLVFGLASLAGVNLYLTLLVLGLAVHFEWMKLGAAYEHLQVLGQPWVLGLVGVMVLVEFVADKVPWFDSVWDVVHTVIRPLGAVMLSVAAMGDASPMWKVVAGILAGGTALSTHSVKAGTRLLVNTSPEPVSNSVASVAEDVSVVGLVALMLAHPWVAVPIGVVLVVVCWVLIWFGYRAVRKAVGAFRERFLRKDEMGRV